MQTNVYCCGCCASAASIIVHQEEAVISAVNEVQEGKDWRHTSSNRWVIAIIWPSRLIAAGQQSIVAPRSLHASYRRPISNIFLLSIFSLSRYHKCIFFTLQWLGKEQFPEVNLKNNIRLIHLHTHILVMACRMHKQQNLIFCNSIIAIIFQRPNDNCQSTSNQTQDVKLR